MPLSKAQYLGLIAVIVFLSGVGVGVPGVGRMALFLAALPLLLLLTAFTRAGRLSQSLQPFKNRRVEVRIWGRRPPQHGDASCEIQSIRALGEGLHLFVRCAASRTEHIKIAQPTMDSVSSEIAQIGQAKYIQWGGKQCPRVAGQPALTLTVVNDCT
jgi:hypothetical protein